MICPCGKCYYETTDPTSPYALIRYNLKGEIYYAVCFHGNIIINKTGKWKDNYNNKGTNEKI